jgi:L-threonylcarbamoyladenylate synthase
VNTEISTDVIAAVELLRKGEVVAVPTETVYGLAADALRAEAVAKVFEVKERPRFDPLIVHIPDHTWFERLVEVSTEEREILFRLIDRFWPGPLTIVGTSRYLVPELVTAGLPTVAVRMSAHPVLRDILQRFGGPVAAPSANRFGRISPTEPSHVRDELGGRIQLIVDGGRTEHGIESTVTTLQNGALVVLRPGHVTEEQLKDFAPIADVRDTETSERPMSTRERLLTGLHSPGQLPSHYAPAKPLHLVGHAQEWDGDRNRAGLLAWRSPATDGFAVVRTLSEQHSLREAAANLFSHLRELDTAENVDVIVAERVPPDGLGRAIMDRLSRAANRDQRT